MSEAPADIKPDAECSDLELGERLHQRTGMFSVLVQEARPDWSPLQMMTIMSPVWEAAGRLVRSGQK